MCNNSSWRRELYRDCISDTTRTRNVRWYWCMTRKSKFKYKSREICIIYRLIHAHDFLHELLTSFTGNSISLTRSLRTIFLFWHCILINTDSTKFSCILLFAYSAMVKVFWMFVFHYYLYAKDWPHIITQYAWEV